MKGSHCETAVLLTFLMLARAARAQPPDLITAPQGDGPVFVRMTPEQIEAEKLKWVVHTPPANVPAGVLSSFTFGDLLGAALEVEGADPLAPELEKLRSVVNTMADRVTWHVRPEAAAPLADNATEVTVKVQVGAQDGIELGLWHEENVLLRLGDSKQGKMWRIVPEKPDTLFTKLRQDSPDVGLVRRVATYLVYPHAAWQWLAPYVSTTQVKQLSLGLMQYVQDWDEKYPPKAATFKDKVLPYLTSPNTLTAPGDPTGRQSYELNPLLAGKGVADLQSPAETVAIYLGHDQQLDFRFDGLTVVGFADGHVQQITAAQAKALRWKP